MNMQSIKKVINQGGESTYRKISKLAETERFIAVLLTLMPLILMFADFDADGKFRPSISNYAYMCDSYWFGSLLGLAGALFIFNGAQHMKGQQIQQKTQIANNPTERFGKGYNIIFGIALFGVIFFDHLSFFYIHLFMTIVFYVGCALAMIFGYRIGLKTWGVTLGVLTLASLGLHLLLNYIYGKDNHIYSLLWAEWVGLVFIAIYFIKDSLSYNSKTKNNSKNTLA